MKTRKTTGLFFGSFNPIHVGHLIIANHMIEYGGLDEVWFVVSPHNPLKTRTTLLEDHHRLALVNVAIEDNPRFKASNIEFGLPRPSYTVVTLAALREKYPDKDFVLIMGSDNLSGLRKWRNYEQILENYRILVYPRPAYSEGEFFNHPSVTFTESPLMEISSTFIRSAIKAGKSVRYLLPEKVHEYILEMHFYKK